MQWNEISVGNNEIMEVIFGKVEALFYKYNIAQIRVICWLISKQPRHDISQKCSPQKSRLKIFKLSFTFEKTTGVLLVKSKKGTGDLTDTGDGQLDSPDFTLVTKEPC